MILKMENNEGFCGNVGVKANFTDSNGDNLYVGDIVKIEGTSELSIVCGDIKNKRFDIMGIWGEHEFINNSTWKIYKEKSYKSMNIGDEIREIKYCKNDIRKVTISEIEEKLGYEIEIIREH